MTLFSHSNPCRRLFVVLPLVAALAACGGAQNDDQLQLRVLTQSEIGLYQSGLQAEREGSYALEGEHYASFLKIFSDSDLWTDVTLLQLFWWPSPQHRSGTPLPYFARNKKK